MQLHHKILVDICESFVLLFMFSVLFSGLLYFVIMHAGRKVNKQRELN